MNAIVVHMGDTHSGGMTSLFPDYPMTFVIDKERSVTWPPLAEQEKIYAHFIKCADAVKTQAIGKQIFVIHNGDAIEGHHHNTIEVVSANPKHHSEIHCELMDTFLDRVGFSVKNGDELHYVSGTESHTGWEEYGIANHFEALGAQYHDELTKEINGRKFQWTHQGPKPGKGVNEGNPLRNFARDVYWDCLKEKKRPPDLLTTSHFHKASYDSFNDSYSHTVHIQVLPSWQRKTRFGLRASPFQRNDIGLTMTEVTDGGDIRIMKPLLMEAE